MLNLIIFFPRPKFEHIQPAMCSEYLVRTHDREYCSLKYVKDNEIQICIKMNKIGHVVFL